MAGSAPTRIPLPLDIVEDGPIYVNAKQYHGILRRRKYRAKLEARNKLVKSRKVILNSFGHLFEFPVLFLVPWGIYSGKY